MSTRVRRPGNRSGRRDLYYGLRPDAPKNRKRPAIELGEYSPEQKRLIVGPRDTYENYVVALRAEKAASDRGGLNVVRRILSGRQRIKMRKMYQRRLAASKRGESFDPSKQGKALA